MAGCHMEILPGLLYKATAPRTLSQCQLIRHDAYKATKHFLMAIKNHSKCWQNADNWSFLGSQPSTHVLQPDSHLWLAMKMPPIATRYSQDCEIFHVQRSIVPCVIVCQNQKHCLCNVIRRRKRIEFVANNPHLKSLNTKGKEGGSHSYKLVCNCRPGVPV